MNRGTVRHYGRSIKATRFTYPTNPVGTHNEWREIMSTPRIALRNVHHFVALRRDFNANGTLVGHGANWGTLGILPDRYRDDFRAAEKADDFYVVVSYATPIAWYANGAWYVPNVRYSQTTSKHQSSTWLVGDGKVWRTKALYANQGAAYVNA